MDVLEKKGDALNPDVQFDPVSGSLKLKGKSIPLNAEQFFRDVIPWLEQYSEHPSDHTKLEIDLKYMNGKSLRSLVTLLYMLKSMNDAGKEVSVTWNIPRDAEDLADLGEELLSDMKLPHDIHLN